jgi:hypothetical protein
MRGFRFDRFPVTKLFLRLLVLLLALFLFVASQFSAHSSIFPIFDLPSLRY